MKISFHGAARTVTGSKHLIHLHPNKKVLLDCGMFQGMGKQTSPLNAQFGFEPTEIDYVIVSHAHVDHIGLLPKLVSEGFKGKIYCTEATAALAEILLKDSANIQESDVRFVNKIRKEQGKTPVEPLYTLDDVYKTIPKLTKVKYGEWLTIDEQVQLMYTDVGHIIGSAAVHLKLTEHGKTVQLTFSGDIGRYNDPLLRSPEQFPQADYLIVESTYGNKLHPLNEPPVETLLKHIITTCIEQKGKLIIPSFSVGRTQELLYALNQLELENRLPDVDYYVDSPLSVKATMLVKSFPHLFNHKVQQVLKKDNDPFMFKGLTMIEDVAASKSLNYMKKPMVIISASGMAEAGRVKHHIANNVENPNNTILMVGYCEPESLGARLQSGKPQVGIFGQQFEVKAGIAALKSLSAHGDFNEISQWLSCQDPQMVKKVFLVHGEEEVQMEMKNKLVRKGFADVEIPHLHQEIGLGEME